MADTGPPLNDKCEDVTNPGKRVKIPGNRPWIIANRSLPTLLLTNGKRTVPKCSTTSATRSMGSTQANLDGHAPQLKRCW